MFAFVMFWTLVGIASAIAAVLLRSGVVDRMLDLVLSPIEDDE